MNTVINDNENTLVCEIEPSQEVAEISERNLFKSFENMDSFKSASGEYYILKHSNACPISAKAYMRVVKALEGNVFLGKPVYLVVVQEQRELSNNIAEFFDIKHESPQLLKIENNKVVKASNHLDILNENKN